jgi:threonyl-tRNA synthetase
MDSNKNNHRTIGISQDLFFFHEFAPGCSFWLPNGTRIYNKLTKLIRDEYFVRGFEEVKSPVIAKKDLWIISDHWNQYKDNMFCFCCDDTEYAMKAMNCPLACLMFRHKVRSYRELPLRLADFGQLHRNEFSGALTGLTRVRQFTQDDCHIFCSVSQIKSEIENALNFLLDVYSKFGFQFEIGLSTRPDKFIGDIEIWNNAEKELSNLLNDSGLKWTEKAKDGAFYGPKIDIHLTDSLNRKHQCGTIQLDFQLPKRFELNFITENGDHDVPVIIHRAIFGSFERFVAILTEHYNGKWPLWISPKQVMIIPITNQQNDYANEIKTNLRLFKFYADVNYSDETLSKKVRTAELVDQYNYILIIGNKEVETKTVSVRYRDNSNKKILTIHELIEELKETKKMYK